MSSLTKDTTNKTWVLNVDQAGSAKLPVKGKFVDRDIEVKVPQGAITLSAEKDGATSHSGGVVTPSISSTSTLYSKLTTTQPEGTYKTITPVASMTDVKATVKVKTKASLTSGYVDASTDEKENSFSIELDGIAATAGDTTSYYLPTSTLSASIISKIENHIDTKPTDDGGIIDKITISFKIPEGYHEEATFTKTIEELLPNFNSTDTLAEASTMLSGTHAYDQNGAILVGTMYNGGQFGSSDGDVVISKASANDAGSVSSNDAVTLSEVNNSGLEVTGKGTLKTVTALTKNGYYEAGSLTSETFTSAEQTKYISDITIADKKTLNSVTVDGGTITTLSMQDGGKISNISGDVIINNVASDATLKVNDTTIIDTTDNGKIPSSDLSISVIENTDGTKTALAKITRGWNSADTTQAVGAGEYGVSCTKTNPSIEYSATVVGIDESATTTSTTSYGIKVSGTVTAGTHTATANISKEGFLQTGSKSTTAEAIDVDGSSEAKTIYLKEAEASTSYSDGSGDVQPYVVSMSAGYIPKTDALVSIATYDGTFNWGANS